MGTPSIPTKSGMETVEITEELRAMEPVFKLSADLGETLFTPVVKGSELNRYITKAYNDGNFKIIETATA